MRLLPAALVLGTAGSLLVACSGDDERGGTTVVATPSDERDATDEPSPTSGEDASGSGRPRVVGTVAEGLAVPWGIAFLPDGSAVVTERDSTRVLRVRDDGTVRAARQRRGRGPRG